MQRKDPNVNREFVCEATDEANLMRLASHGHAVDLLFYLTALANDKIELFFNDVTKAETFIKCFPNRQSREAFLNGVLQSKTKLMPLVPPAFIRLLKHCRILINRRPDCLAVHSQQRIALLPE